MLASSEVGTIQLSSSLTSDSQPQVEDANKVITCNLEGPYLIMFCTDVDVVAPPPCVAIDLVASFHPFLSERAGVCRSPSPGGAVPLAAALSTGGRQ